MVYLVIPYEKNVRGFEVTLSNIPGTLNKITSIISRHNLNIYYIETCYRTEKKYELFIAIDFTDKDISPDKLLEEFRNQEYVEEAEISPMFKRVIYPSKFCSIDLGGIRGIIFAEANMRGFIEGIKEEMGDKIGDAFLYRAGYEVGRVMYRLYADKLGIETIEEGIETLKALGRGAGWTNIREVKSTDNKIVIRVERLWECEIQKGKVVEPASHYARGIFAGFFKEFLNKAMEVKETKCIALGDPYCEFEIDIKESI